MRSGRKVLTVRGSAVSRHQSRPVNLDRSGQEIQYISDISGIRQLCPYRGERADLPIEIQFRANGNITIDFRAAPKRITPDRYFGPQHKMLNAKLILRGERKNGLRQMYIVTPTDCAAVLPFCFQPVD